MGRVFLMGLLLVAGCGTQEPAKATTATAPTSTSAPYNEAGEGGILIQCTPPQRPVMRTGPQGEKLPGCE